MFSKDEQETVFHDHLHDLILCVDENDNPTGTGTKLEVHQEGRLHRAFSVLVFNASGEMLLQKRALHKYHSGGLWTNTCCSHPHLDESVDDAVHRRLKEEMSFDCPLTKVDILHYKSPELPGGLYENEILHLYAGVSEQNAFFPNSQEVMDWCWASIEDVQNEIKNDPNSYSYWLSVYIGKYDFQDIFESLSNIQN